MSTDVPGDLALRMRALESELRDARAALHSKAVVEAALGESEARLRALVEASSDVLYTMSPDWTVLRQLSGSGFLADTPYPSRTWLREYVPSKDRARVLATIRGAVRTRSAFALEHRVRRRDGTVGWALSRAVPRFGKDGDVVEWFGSASDVTARKHAEEALLATRERQAFLLRLSDTLRPLCQEEDIETTAARLLCEHLRADRVCCCDIHGEPGERVALVRGEWAGDQGPLPARLDYEPFEQGWPIRSCSPGSPIVVADIEADQRPGDGAKAAWRSLGVRALIGVASVQHGRRRANLSVIQNVPRAWLGSEVVLVQQAAERTWAAVERGSVETTLREREEQLRQTIELSPNLLWWADPRGERIGINSQWAAYTGQTLQETQNFGWLDAVHPDDLAETRAAFQHAFATGEPVERQQRIHRRGDGYRWHLVRHVPVRNEDGRIIQWFGAATDIHDLRQLQDRQALLVAELQHRTRNLITVVRSLSKRTLDTATGLLDFSTRFNLRMEALSRVQGLLSRLSGGARLAFDQLLRTELTALGGPAERITLEGPSGVPLRSTTVQTFALALHELATNAVKYGALSPAGGQLHIRWRVVPAAGDRAASLHLEWLETGVAMPVATGQDRADGYGRKLIEAGLPYQLGAETSYEMGPDGVRCVIRIPLPVARLP